jgi:hypothetical protein
LVLGKSFSRRETGFFDNNRSLPAVNGLSGQGADFSESKRLLLSGDRTFSRKIVLPTIKRLYRQAGVCNSEKSLYRQENGFTGGYRREMPAIANDRNYYAAANMFVSRRFADVFYGRRL